MATIKPFCYSYCVSLFFKPNSKGSSPAESLQSTTLQSSHEIYFQSLLRGTQQERVMCEHTKHVFQELKMASLVRQQASCEDGRRLYADHVVQQISPKYG